MRMLVLNYEYPPLGGGAANASAYILREMSHRDIEIDLVTSSASSSFEIAYIGDNVTIHKLAVGKKKIHYWTQKEILIYSWKARRYVKSLMKGKDYDVCHAFFGIPCGAIAYLFRKRMPYIVSLRGSDVPGFNKRFSLQYLFLKPIVRRVWRKASAVVANSDGLRALAYETDPKCKIGIIYNGIDTEQFKPAASGVAGDRRRILCVSRLIERKGLDHLIRSVPIMKERLGDVFEVVIVGEGNLETELKSLSEQLGVADLVDFKGYIPHDNLPETYAGSDLFVLPSKNEGMSNTVLEAMACGLPIVATNTGGTSELVKGNGIVLANVDAGAIADALTQLVQKSDERAQMGHKSREIAESMSWGKVADQYVALYEESLRRTD